MNDEELNHRLDTIETLLKANLDQWAINSAKLNVLFEVLPQLLSGRRFDEDRAREMIQAGFHAALVEADSKFRSELNLARERIEKNREQPKNSN